MGVSHVVHPPFLVKSPQRLERLSVLERCRHTEKQLLVAVLWISKKLER